MASYEVACVGCSLSFEAKARNAKWCSPACKKRAQRDPGPPADESQGGAPEEHGLVKAVRLELERAEKVDTFSGQLALQLATKLANPAESGSVALSKELRAVMEVALGKPAVGADPELAVPVVEDDEVTKARRAREQKARQAARRA